MEERLRLTIDRMERVSQGMHEARMDCESLRRANVKLQEDVEALRGEIDLRRSQALRSEAALRQQEAWRNEMEAELASLRQQTRFNERLAKDHEELLKTVLIRSDLESGVYLERLSSSIQRSVVGSLAGMKIQPDAASLLESVPSSIDKESQDSRFQLQLESQIHSKVELAMHTLQAKLEESVLAKALFELRNEIRDVKADCSNRIARIAATLGVVEGETSPGMLSNMSTHSVRILEKSLASLEYKVDTFESNIRSAKTQSDLQEKSFRAELATMQGRVDDCIAFAETQLSLAKDRASNLENLVKFILMSILLEHL